MITLFLDTSSNYLYTGLVKNSILVSEVKEKLDRDLSSLTLPKIDEMLKANQILPNNIDNIVVVNGPGSFTGIRIGITIAKTWAWAMKCKIYTISSLEAFALSTTAYDYVVPMIDARRNHVFGAIFDKGMNPILRPQYLSFEALRASTSYLPGTIKYVTHDNLQVENNEVVMFNPNILQIVLYALKKDPVNPHSVEPEYLKLTEAEESKQNA